MDTWRKSVLGNGNSNDLEVTEALLLEEWQRPQCGSGGLREIYILYIKLNNL